MAYLETPRTDAGNTSYLDNLDNTFGLDGISPEKSFHSPQKRVNEIFSQKGLALGKANARGPLGNRPNQQNPLGKDEISLLLKSTKKRSSAGKENLLVTHVPAFLRDGNLASPTPNALDSFIASSDAGSYTEDRTLLPPMPDSSAPSTPHAILPLKSANGVLADPRNLMTLREQENMIDKIEKENFGLKLKIHYLEEIFQKADPNYHTTAMKENTDLKIDKQTLNRDLKIERKRLGQIEREVEDLRQQLLAEQEASKRKHADKRLREELDSVRRELEVKTTEVRELETRLQKAELHDDALEKLQGNVEDLEIEIREKEQIIDQKDDELERLDEQIVSLSETEQRLADARKDVAELEDLRVIVKDIQGNMQRAKQEARNARENQAEAERVKQKAIHDLEELQDKMANKSSTARVLPHEIEKKADKLEDDLQDLRQKYANLQNSLDEKTREARRLQESMAEARQLAEGREQKLKGSITLLKHEKETALDHAGIQVHKMAKGLETRTDEKDLLQTRHDALTIESHGLQRDLAHCHTEIESLRQALNDEKRHAAENERALRDEARRDIEDLQTEVDKLQRRLEDEQGHAAANEDRWETQRRALQTEKEKAEQKALGLQRAIDKLQQSEGDLSGQEKKLKDALESETQRHESEEAVLNRRIKELREEVEEKRQALGGNRSELLRLQEELRLSKRDHAAYKEKVQALEDEIEVLSSSLDEESERSKADVAGAKHEAESSRRQIHAMEQQITRLEMMHADARGEIEALQGDLQAKDRSREQLSSRIRDLEAQLQCVREDKEKIQEEVARVSLQLDEARCSQAEANQDDVSILRRNLTASRDKEANYLEREGSYKENILSLKRDTADLERKIHQLEISKLAKDSPKSSVNGSAHKNELDELRRSLAEAHQQSKELRTRFKEAEHSALRRFHAAEQASKSQAMDFEQLRGRLEDEMEALKMEREHDQAQKNAAEKTASRLRTRIASLERDLHAARSSRAGGNAMAEERKDLHDMLKDAKLEAEDLQVQVAERQSRIEASARRETDLRAQLRCAREERTLQARKSEALQSELESVRARYEAKVDETTRQQQVWEHERKSILSRVRFPEQSVSTAQGDGKDLKELEDDVAGAERRHAAELKGLGKQIQWLRAKGRREEGFRAGLVFEKKWLMMQVEMFQACNTADLRLLEDMGVTPDRRVPKKRPSLRAVACMVLAGVRMRRLQSEWAVQKKLRASLVKKAEQACRGGQRRRSSSSARRL